MDLIRPLEKSATGYVLDILDYATRYLEAITAKKTLAVELLKVSPSVPKEILTYQGTYFTSHLLKEVLIYSK